MKRKEMAASLKQKRDAAMPEIKRLVKEHGRTVIHWCLEKMRLYDKQLKKLQKMKEKVAELEKATT